MKKKFIDTTAVEGAVVEFEEYYKCRFSLEEDEIQMIFNGVEVMNKARKSIIETILSSYERVLIYQSENRAYIHYLFDGEDTWDGLIIQTEYRIKDLKDTLIDEGESVTLKEVFELIRDARYTLNEEERAIIEKRMHEMYSACKITVRNLEGIEE